MSSLPVPDSPSRSTLASAGATFSTVRHTLHHLRTASQDAFERRMRRRFLQAHIFVFQLVETVGTIDDKTQQVGVDRLVEEIIGAQADRVQGVLAVAVAGNDDDLGGGRGIEYGFEERKPFAGAVRYQAATRDPA